MAVVKKTCNYQKYLFFLISFTCVISVLCSNNVFNELFLQHNKEKSCPVSSTHDSLPEQNFQDKTDASIKEDEPKEKNVFDTLKVILKKVKHEVNSDTQRDSSVDGSLNVEPDAVNDINHNLVNETPTKLSDENVPVESHNITNKSKLDTVKSDTEFVHIDVPERDFSDDSQSLKKAKEDKTKLLKTPKPSSEEQEQVTGKLTFTTIFESLSDNQQSKERLKPTEEQQKIQQQFESIPHKGTYTDILKLPSEPVPQNESSSQLKDEEEPVLPQKIKQEEIEGAESPLPKNDSILEEKSHKILNETEGEVAVDLTKPSAKEILDEVAVDLAKPSAEEIQETDVNTSTVLPQKDILDEARKEKDQLETYSQFAERVSAEKKNGVGNGHSTNGQTSKGSKVKSKNYASTDCGAKFIAANPEASHSHKIINSNKDEYMLNKCTEKLWVVVELCESIKPQKFDIANFELFSNLPKEIQLYGSHRYPTREWITLGTYVGEEGNRGTQSFRIETQEFLKYVKLEIHSHYGTEFYCPLSQFRIYGMSEFEVIEEAEDTEEEPVIEEEEVELEAKEEKEKDKRGIMIPDVFKAIFNGVLEVIKRGSRTGNLTEESELIKYNENCKSLKDEFTIKNESCHFADSLNYILACYYDEYLKLMFNPIISQVVKNYDFCYRLATIICSSHQNNDSYVYDSICNNSYACVMLSPKHILAMCHMNNPMLLSDLLACETEGESNDAKNLSTIDSTIGELPLDITILDNKGEKFTDIEKKLPSDEKNTSSYSKKIIPPSHTNGVKIEPLSNNLDSDLPVETSRDTKQTTEEEAKSDPSTSEKKAENASSPVISEKPEKVDKTEKQGDSKKDKKVEKTQEKSPSNSEDHGSLPITTTTTTPSPSTAIPSSGTEGRVSSHSNKESVVVRLSNKIKVLEQNMSISSQYLEELSRRYKIQMEEMERQFNITIHALNRTSQIAYERDLYHQKRIEGLEEQVEKLTNVITALSQEKDNFMKSIFEHHVIFLIIQVLVVGVAFTFCMKRVRAGLLSQDFNHPSTPVASQIQNQNNLMKNNSIAIYESEMPGRETSPQFRRMSADNLKTGNQDRPKERRLSGQTALKGTYQDLLITEQNSTNAAGNPKEKKRKKKKVQLQRSMSNVSIHESKLSSSMKEGKLEKLKKSSAGVLFSGEKIAQSSKPKAKSEGVNGQSVEEMRQEDWQLVKRNKSKKWKNELNSQQEEEPNYVFSSDLKRGKITVVEEPFRDVYPHPYYTEILYDDYVYDKAYIEEEYNGCDYDSQVVETNGISDSINHVYATPEFDYNVPVINDYYHNARDSPSYCVVESEIDHHYGHATNEDNHINLWNNSVLTKPIVKQLKNTSIPPSLKGKTRLRSDNWEWYSSQPSRLLPKSCSTEIVSNSSSDSNGKPKQQEQKPEIKNSKEKFEKKKRRKKSKLVVNGENP